MQEDFNNIQRLLYNGNWATAANEGYLLGFNATKLTECYAVALEDSTMYIEVTDLILLAEMIAEYKEKSKHKAQSTKHKAQSTKHKGQQMNKLYIDVETTGLDSAKHGIIALAYMLESSEGEKLARGTIYINTFTYTKVYSAKALEINEFTVEEIKDFANAKDSLREFDNILTKYSNEARYQIVAYNAAFDKGFLEALYNKYLPGRFWKVITHKVIDTLQLVVLMQDMGLVNTGKSQSLGAVCEYLNIPLSVHEADSDNYAQYTVYKILSEAITEHKALIQETIDKGIK